MYRSDNSLAALAVFLVRTATGSGMRDVGAAAGSVDALVVGTAGDAVAGLVAEVV